MSKKDFSKVKPLYIGYNIEVNENGEEYIPFYDFTTDLKRLKKHKFNKLATFEELKEEVALSGWYTTRYVKVVEGIVKWVGKEINGQWISYKLIQNDYSLEIITNEGITPIEIALYNNNYPKESDYAVEAMYCNKEWYDCFCGDRLYKSFDTWKRAIERKLKTQINWEEFLRIGELQITVGS